MYMQFLGWSQIVISVTAICTAVMISWWWNVLHKSHVQILTDKGRIGSLQTTDGTRILAPPLRSLLTEFSNKNKNNFSKMSFTVAIEQHKQYTTISCWSQISCRMADIQGGKESFANSNCVLCDICYDVERLEAGQYFLVTAEAVGQNFHQLLSGLTVHYIEFRGFDCWLRCTSAIDCWLHAHFVLSPDNV